MLKLASPPTPNLKFALPPTPTPDASQWNIGGVWPSGVGAGVGHVHLIFLVLISFALRSVFLRWRRKLYPAQKLFSVEYGLIVLPERSPLC